MPHLRQSDFTFSNFAIRSDAQQHTKMSLNYENFRVDHMFSQVGFFYNNVNIKKKQCSHFKSYTCEKFKPVGVYIISNCEIEVWGNANYKKAIKFFLLSNIALFSKRCNKKKIYRIQYDKIFAEQYSF